MSWEMGLFIFSIVLYAGVTLAVKIAEKRIRKKVSSVVVADNVESSINDMDKEKEIL